MDGDILTVLASKSCISKVDNFVLSRFLFKINGYSSRKIFQICLHYIVCDTWHAGNAIMRGDTILATMHASDDDNTCVF